MKSSGESGERSLVMREYSATVGATDGNIIAAIITTQTPRNQPSVPRPVHGPSSMPLHLVGRPPPADAGEGEEQRDEPEPGARGGEGRGETRAAPACLRVRSRAQAAQENSDVESPVLPSYSMPKALIRERFASAIVRSDATGWNMP